MIILKKNLLSEYYFHYRLYSFEDVTDLHERFIIVLLLLYERHVDETCWNFTSVMPEHAVKQRVAHKCAGVM